MKVNRLYLMQKLIKFEKAQSILDGELKKLSIQIDELELEDKTLDLASIAGGLATTLGGLDGVIKAMKKLEKGIGI